MLHAEAAPTLADCADLLAQSEVYDADLDLPQQRASLISFYESTGGPYWTKQAAQTSSSNQYPRIVANIIEATSGLATGSLDTSTLPTELVSDAASIVTLSENCQLQQYLSLGQLWLTYNWGSSVSYCHWTGVTCCQTVGKHQTYKSTNNHLWVFLILLSASLLCCLPIALCLLRCLPMAYCAASTAPLTSNSANLICYAVVRATCCSSNALVGRSLWCKLPYQVPCCLLTFLYMLLHPCMLHTTSSAHQD